MLPPSTTAHSFPPTFMRLVLTLPSRLPSPGPAIGLGLKTPGGVPIEDEATRTPPQSSGVVQELRCEADESAIGS